MKIIIIEDASVDDLPQIMTMTKGVVINNTAPKEWLTGDEFEKELWMKGYKATTRKTRKKYCERFGLQYRQRGNKLEYQNLSDKIQAR